MTPTKIPCSARPSAALSSRQGHNLQGGIFLVDYHPIVLAGLGRLIREEPDWQICGTATEYQDALRQIRNTRPELVVVNLDLGGRSGLELVRELQELRPRPSALVFSMHDERLYAARALRAGASGYVMKDEHPDTILEAIRQVLEGGTYLSQRVTQNGRLQRAQKPGPVLDRLETLTNRELHIFRLIGQGKRSQEIAGLLSVSVKTVGSHRSNMMAKLSLENSSQLVQHAIELNREHRRELKRQDPDSPLEVTTMTALPTSAPFPSVYAL